MPLQGAVMFWVGNHPGATGKTLPQPEELITNPHNLSQLKLMSQGYRKGMEFIVQNPLKELRLILKKTSLFFSLLRSDGWWLHMKGWDRISALTLSFLFSLFLSLFGTVGFVFSYRNGDPNKFWMRSFIIISFLSLLPFIVEARHRFPIYPFMIIFSSYGLSLLPEIKSAFKVKEKISLGYLKISVILIVILLVNTIFDFVINFGEIINRVEVLFQ